MRMSPLKRYMATKKGPRSATTHTNPADHCTPITPTCFDELKATAPQLTPLQCWYRILSEAMKKYLKGAVLKPPDLINYMS